MAKTINKAYDDAVASGLLTGISAFAGDKHGNIIYTHSAGKITLNPTRLSSSPLSDLFFTPSTICAVASMTKLLTSVAALQCVQSDLLDLDADVRTALPLPLSLADIGKHGILNAFDSASNTGTFTPLPTSSKITTRMLLSHTSGHEADWFSPVLGAWRASRGEIPFGGPTVADKCAVPLTFAPGEGWAYGQGHDWAGKVVEVVSGKTLDEFMRERIWGVLGVGQDEAGFWLGKKKGNKTEEGVVTVADMSTLSDKGEGPAQDASGFDILFGAEECLGGAGMYCSSRAYYTFLSAVFRRDERLLSCEMYDELFRPQLDEKQETALNEYLDQSQTHADFLGARIPASIRKSWSFAGLVAKEGQEGRLGKGAIVWGGLPSCQWVMDWESGYCAVSVCQMLPPMCPSIMALHEELQKGVHGIVRGGKNA